MIKTILYSAASLRSAAASVKERFSSHEENTDRKQMLDTVLMEFIAAVVIYIIFLILVLVVGKFLWNSVIAGSEPGSTGLITIARPARSMWDVLLLFIFMNLFVGGSH